MRKEKKPSQESHWYCMIVMLLQFLKISCHKRKKKAEQDRLKVKQDTKLSVDARAVSNETNEKLMTQIFQSTGIKGKPDELNLLRVVLVLQSTMLGANKWN